MNKFFHSVYLDEKLCTGCINCIKRCPTEAIRVRNGRACITSKQCIDCGVCVQTCHQHAKKIHIGTMSVLNNYAYTVALPEPSLYAQFNNLKDINILLTAFIYLGFDDVFEIGAAAELVSEASREYVEKHTEQWPFISTACPSVVRLIRVRFPNLIEHLLPINSPFEVAATMARKRAMEKTGLPADQIGIIHISPCPSKVSHPKMPLGKDHSEIDECLAVKDIYPLLLPHMKDAESHPMDLSVVGRIGIGWGYSGGEAGGMMTNSYLAADGIENVIRVLEDLEDEKFEGLQFIELNACSGGCVGGVLNIENPYVAQAKLHYLNKYVPVALNHQKDFPYDGDMFWNAEVEYEPVFQIGENIIDSIKKMKQIEELCKEFPGLDCGCCGAPTCKALAEDIVRGRGAKNDCIHILRNNIHDLAKTYSQAAREIVMGSEDPDACIYMLMHNFSKLTTEMSQLDSHNFKRRRKRGSDVNDSQ